MYGKTKSNLDDQLKGESVMITFVRADRGDVGVCFVSMTVDDTYEKNNLWWRMMLESC